MASGKSKRRMGVEEEREVEERREGGMAEVGLKMDRGGEWREGEGEQCRRQGVGGGKGGRGKMGS